MHETTRATPARWLPLTGAASVVLWIAALVADDRVDSRASDATIVAFYAKRSHRSTEIVTFFLILAATIAFAWFVSALRARIAQAEGRTAVAATVALVSGTITAALWVAAAAIAAAVPGTIDIDEAKPFVLDPNSYRLMSGLGDLIFFSATTVGLLLVAATSATARRTGLLPRWLAWLGFIVAASMVASFLFLPFLAFLGWILLVSVSLASRSSAG
jgi:hypothetical protein